jgi:hypothetical protein
MGFLSFILVVCCVTLLHRLIIVYIYKHPMMAGAVLFCYYGVLFNGILFTVFYPLIPQLFHAEAVFHIINRPLLQRLFVPHMLIKPLQPCESGECFLKVFYYQFGRSAMLAYCPLKLFYPNLILMVYHICTLELS